MPDLRVSVAEILGRPGENRRLALSERVPGIRIELAEVSAERPVTADLRLESVVEGVLVSGPAAAPARFRCARCLKEISGRVELDICELFALASHAVADEDAYRVEGDTIDLEPMLRDVVTLALPLNPLCDADCKGLCAQCGQEMATHSVDCVQEKPDPRWAQLDALREKLDSR